MDFPGVTVPYVTFPYALQVETTPVVFPPAMQSCRGRVIIEVT